MKKDVIIIGAGTAGLRLALQLSKQGKSVALFESGSLGGLGGTCLNVGCIPTKALLHASNLYKESKDLKKFGIKAVSGFDFKKLVERVKGMVREGQNHIRKSIKRKNLVVVRKEARFVNENTVKAGNILCSADHIIIATGAHNCIPQIKGLEKIPYLTNENVLNLRKLPKSMIMIGGGYICMEFATFFSELGCKVAILEKAPDILMMLDDDIREELKGMYTEMVIHTNADILECRKRKKVEVDYVVGRKRMTARGDALFIATGRAPNTEHLDVKHANIETDHFGNIIVNEKLQTTNNRVYAVGDCNGKAMFAHAAKREAAVVLHNILNEQKQEIFHDLIPWAVFTHPPIAGVGMNQRTADSKGIPYEIKKANFTRAGRAEIIGKSEGFVKVLVEKVTGKIIGAFIIGQNADDLIHEFVAVMNSASPTFETIKKTVHIHPTLSEVMEAL